MIQSNQHSHENTFIDEKSIELKPLQPGKRHEYKQ